MNGSRSFLRLRRSSPRRGDWRRRAIAPGLFFVVVTADDLAGVGRGRRDVLSSTRIAAANTGESSMDLICRRTDRSGSPVLGATATIGWEAGWGPAPVKRMED